MTFNMARVKYIVAREGLIIITCVAISGSLAYIDSYKKKTIGDYRNRSVKYELIRPSTEKPLSGKYFGSLEKSVSFPVGTDEQVINNTIKRDFGIGVEAMEYDKIQGRDIFDKLDEGDIVAQYNERGVKIFDWYFWKTSIDFILLALFAYPLYLLARFVIWSARVIRKGMPPNSA